MKEQQLQRSHSDIDDAVLVRLENLQDFVEDYKKGKRGRIKSIASELRALVVSGGHNNAILFKVASRRSIELRVSRDVPPVQGLKPELSLEENLNETCFMSAVPNQISFTRQELIRAYANQQGSHEDEEVSEKLVRVAGGGIQIGGVQATDAVLIDIALTVLNSSTPLIQQIKNG